MPILESIALGCNVFAPNIEVFKEIYKDNIFYYEKNDIESLKESLEKYLYKPDLLSQKKTCAQKYSSNYSWDKVADQTLKTYF